MLSSSSIKVGLVTLAAGRAPLEATLGQSASDQALPISRDWWLWVAPSWTISDIQDDLKNPSQLQGCTWLCLSSYSSVIFSFSPLFAKYFTLKSLEDNEETELQWLFPTSWNQSYAMNFWQCPPPVLPFGKTVTPLSQDISNKSGTSLCWIFGSHGRYFIWQKVHLA